MLFATTTIIVPYSNFVVRGICNGLVYGVIAMLVLMIIMPHPWWPSVKTQIVAAPIYQPIITMWLEHTGESFLGGIFRASCATVIICWYVILIEIGIPRLKSYYNQTA
jgi:hypothetical protein